MAIIRSTPQAIINSTSSNGPFAITAVVPAGGLCAVFVMSTHALDAALEQAASISVTDNGSHTWFKRAHAYNRNDGAVYASSVWVYDWYNDTGSSANLTITVNTSGIRYDPVVRIAAQVLTGVEDTANYTPMTITTYTHQVPNVEIIPTAVGSQILAAVSSRVDGGSGDVTAAYTAISGSTIDSNLKGNNGQHAGAVVARTTTEVTRWNKVTVGASAPFQANAIHSLAAVEYLPAGATGGTGTILPRGAAGARIAIIGDSLMNQGGQGQTNVPAAFAAAGWPSGGIWFRGVDGKQIVAPEGGSGLTTLDNIVQARADLGAEPDLWLIQLLGNDFSSTDQQIRDDIQLVLDELGPNARVAWVSFTQNVSATVNILRGNAIVEDMMANRPNSYVIDWREYAMRHNNPDSWYTDGTHMTPIGYATKNTYMAAESIEGLYEIIASAPTRYRVRAGGAWVSADARTRVGGSWVADVHFGVLRDEIAPPPPTITSVATFSSLTPTISGTAEANSVIAVYLDGHVYNTTTNGAGDWSVQATNNLNDGQSYVLNATATDAAGNTSVAATQNVTVSLASQTPADFAGLALWLKADSITGLATGANVTSWQDTTHSLTATPSGTAPTFAATSTPAGIGSVRFATSRTPLTVAGTATPTDTLTYIAVAKLDALLAETVLISAQTGGCFGGGMRNASMTSIQPGTTWFGDGPSGQVDTNWHVYVWTYDNAADTITYTVDGVSNSVSTANGPMNSNIYFIGSAAAGFGGFGGLVAEIATFSRVLDSSEITSLTEALSNKYGL